LVKYITVTFSVSSPVHIKNPVHAVKHDYHNSVSLKTFCVAGSNKCNDRGAH